jgi:endonuclease YncB( thermonuclease family)
MLRYLQAALVTLVMATAFLTLILDGSSDRLMPAIGALDTDRLTATFPVCGDQHRITCVVDGDTFWLNGVKIRIADIDTPELSPSRCEAERIKGEAAKYRLQELLNAGAFSLASADRDEDRFGRKLRIVTRSGRSIGAALIGEGLARRWDGSRHPWCD